MRFWHKRYDGTIDSLKKKSRSPSNLVNKQKEEQTKLIEKVFKSNSKKQKLEYYGAIRKKVINTHISSF